MMMSNTEEIQFIISTLAMEKDSDEITDNSSRLSENIQLLRSRSPRSPSNISTFIFSALILILISTVLLLINAFYYAQKSELPHDTSCLNQHAKENFEKLDRISRKLEEGINSRNIRNSMEFMANRTHIAGTSEQARLNEYLAKQYASLGYDVKMYNYTVLLNYPHTHVPNIIEIMNKNGDWRTISHGRGVPIGVNGSTHHDYDIRSQHWWMAYSANGTVQGEMVYCNYGLEDDYDYLAEIGVDVQNKIALIRYGGLKRYEKVRLAQQKGIVGVVLFSDPVHFASVNESKRFPFGYNLPGFDAQRGSVLGTQGDPLTPALPSLIYTHREESEDSARRKGSLPKIPVIPIGFHDAKKLMDTFDGMKIKNSEWRGGLNVTYRISGSHLYQVTVHSRFVHRTISNVIAILKGVEDPEQWIMMGNHVDAWGNGAIDPISGTSTQLEVARVMMDVFKNEPAKRTIVFCHWDAEEFGLIGSSEWVEEMQHILHRRAVAYINVDHIAGSITPDIKSVPLLYRTIVAAAKKTKQTNTAEKSMRRNRLFDSWRYHKSKGPIFGDRGVPEINLPTSGSDYQRFISYLGVASADLKMENKPGQSYPLYHTMYETPWMVKTFMDPSFESFAMMGKFCAELVHRLANSMIIPFDVIDYSTVLGTLVHKMESQLINWNITRTIPTINEQIILLKDALKRFTVAAKEFQTVISEIENGSREATTIDIKVINSRLQEIERCFIDWSSSDPLNRHVVFNQSRYFSNISFFSTIQESAKNITIHHKREDMKTLALSFSKLQFAIESGIKVLTL